MHFDEEMGFQYLGPGITVLSPSDPRPPTVLLAPSLALCSCKSKSHIVTNFPIRPHALSGIEKAGYGVHAVTATAPALGLTLFGRRALDEQGAWIVCSSPTSLRESKPAPFQKFQQRLRSFSSPTLSIIARTNCFNTYILSVMPYTASYFGLSSADLTIFASRR